MTNEPVGRSDSPLVLIADDDAGVRLVAREALKRAGFQVVEAASGAQALSAFAEFHPRLVLLDVVMPIMDGFQVCRAIRESPGGKATPILMLTGLEDTESIDKAYEAGATDFATKPIQWAILVHRVRYVLRACSVLEELHESTARLAESQEIAHLGHWERHIETDEVRISDEALRIFGFDPGAETPRFEDLLERIAKEDRALLLHAAEEMGRGRNTGDLNMQVQIPGQGTRYIQHRARLIPMEEGQPARISGTFQDITERHNSEERIVHLAHYDQVTGLPNRVLLMDRLRVALTAARRTCTKVAALFLDLDRFKRINDTLGHSAGDRLLATMAERLRNSIRETDSVIRSSGAGTGNLIARFGGDEFVLVLTGISRAVDTAGVARRILDALHTPFQLDGHEVTIGASIGISVFPDDGGDAETLLRNADTAMYQAKESGRGVYQFYTESMNAVAFQRLAMENSLRKAIERSEFELFYQPQIELATGRILGAEALIRWRHPDQGLVSPAEFIPLAEETGLIIDIGDWVLRTACRQAVNWRHAGFSPLRMAVNVSTQQFAQSDFLSMVASALQTTGLEPGALEIEITESVLMRDEAATLKTLNNLKALGPRIAIDDFGTGYSSLAYLRRFAVNSLKIDRSFISRIAESPDDAAMVGAIIAMARSLRLETIAEGVETVEQLAILQRLGYHVAQGYLLGSPVPAVEFESFLKKAESGSDVATPAGALPDQGA